jgi:Dolichyl-phosphate-mannose-protein mannosyltransferase
MNGMSAAAQVDDKLNRTDSAARTFWLPLIGIAGGVMLLHILTNDRYGFHRDELQFLSDARHLDWGYVSYPPLTPLIEHLALAIFGLSLTGLRLFSVIAQGIAIVVCGLMARELGGGRLAQVTTALAVAFSPLPLFNGTEFQYTSFDFLWWVLIAYFVARILRTGNPRWWLAVGACVGVGLQTKYAVVFFVAGVLGGLALSRSRVHLKSRWFWGGVALAVLIFAPNLAWLVRHDFISYHFLQSIHARDVGQGRADGFLRDQLMICINVFATPLALAGLVMLLRDARFRMLAWMYLITFALFWIGKGRGYYLAGAYPMLMAMGAVAGERWIAGLPQWGRRSVEAVFFAGLAVGAAYMAAIVLPLASSGPLRDFALANNGDLREEFGWDDLVRTVAGIRDSLPPDEQAHTGVLVGNYGEQGAIEMLGPAYHLPLPISMTNSAWLRRYPAPPPTTLIVIGFSRESADRTFADCRLAGHNSNSTGVKNEESKAHPDIFVCGAPRQPWPEFWKSHQRYG